MLTISSQTADEAWRSAAESLLNICDEPAQPSRAGQTIEILHVAFHIEQPTQRWVASRTPAMNPAFALVEVFWILAGRRDSRLPNFWNPALPRFSGHNREYHGAYGYRLRAHLGIDQLDRVFHALDAAPETRQCVFQIWDSRIDLPSSDGRPVSEDVPCNVIAMPKIRRGRLEWTQIIRSNDLFLGVPYNIVQFTFLQEVLSGWLGVGLGAYDQWSDSLHIYIRDIEAVRNSLSTRIIPRSAFSFALDRRTWDNVMCVVMNRLEALTTPSLSREEFRTVTYCRDLPSAYNNAVLIAAADIARRKDWAELSEQCVDECTDDLLIALWRQWQSRQAKSASTMLIE